MLVIVMQIDCESQGLYCVEQTRIHEHQRTRQQIRTMLTRVPITILLSLNTQLHMGEPELTAGYMYGCLNVGEECGKVEWSCYCLLEAHSRVNDGALRYSLETERHQNVSRGR